MVFIPKCRRRTLYVELRRHLGEVFRRLAEQKESRIEEGHLLADHVHMLISIPPKYAVSQVIGFIKGKSAIHLARVLPREETKLRRPALLGERVLRIHSWAGHRSDTGLHQEARRGGHAPRADELVALTATFRWPQQPGPRQRPHSRFERLTDSKPPALPGDAYWALPLKSGSSHGCSPAAFS